MFIDILMRVYTRYFPGSSKDIDWHAMAGGAPALPIKRDLICSGTRSAKADVEVCIIIQTWSGERCGE